MERAKRYLVNALILSGCTLLMRTVGVAFNAFCVDRVGAEGMGLFSLVMSVYTFAVTFATSGVNLAATRLVALHVGRGEGNSARSAMRSCLLYAAAFGTAATMGTICVSVGISMGMDPVLLGGAMLSGVYFGDRCSPVSTSALLVSELTETNIYDNIKRMLKTALVPFLLSCGVYAVLGIVKSGSGAAGELWSLYGREMTLHWVMCLPAVLILLLSVLRVNVKKAMSVSILAAVVLCIFLRHLDAVTILKTAILGYTASDAEVGAMLNGGGIISMVRVALIVMISSAYSGIFRKTGLLDGLCGRVTALRDKTSPYASMLLTAVLASLLACNQTLTIILTHQLCAPSQKDKEEFAINLENSAVVVAPLIPWSIAGATPLSTVGAPMTGMAFACFLYILPLCELVRRTAQQRAAKKAAAQK